MNYISPLAAAATAIPGGNTYIYVAVGLLVLFVALVILRAVRRSRKSGGYDAAPTRYEVKDSQKKKK